ncbi:cellulose synthase-like protein E6 isoform X1 [Carex littledalei]|uniref:Cellulose synthase-like protein E6 isoform X1 n=1 Tax=Carex littledalei TaxID=544730 RepID=A0A833QMA1_9POAL|nr:cellulose synthase-like protein E6 isoform X1 [Carex littledalei]
MGVSGKGKLPLFETKVREGRTWYKLYVLSVLLGICLILVHRALHIPANGEKGRWAWIGLSMAEIWFGFYWILTQSTRWNPVYRRTFKDRLSTRYKDLPGVDIYVCTADPKIEPPIMVISTVLSVMAYEYPTEKLSVYLSDDGGSDITFYAFLEASRFAKAWIPFCKKFKIEPRSPAAYFKESYSGPDDKLVEWMEIKRLYEGMERSINSVANSGVVPDDIRKQHKGFSEWNGNATRSDHQPIVQILVDGRDEGARDNEGHVLPTLVYMAREKRPHRHHNFKAGAMNSLLRVSSEISNGALILNVDCDMYSNNSETIKDALCFFMDEEKGHEFAFVQLPQHYNNITKNDLYGNSLLAISEIDFHGLDGHGGPLYIGTGCYHRRESLLGKKYDKTHKLELVEKERDYKSTASALEERAKNLVTCTFEDNTQWGNKVGLKYGCPVEDVITGLSIQCNGWKSVYFNPQRRGFLGVAPVTLEQILIQHKRWSEGNLQILLSRYSPVSYGRNKITLGLQMCYSIYCLWAPCSIPTLCYAIIPPIYFLHGISLFPDVSDSWFLPFAYVITVTSIYSLLECLEIGYTPKGWWNEQRIWLYKRLASYPFALFDTALKQIGIAKSAFVITAKVASDEVLKRYEKEVIEFGSASLPFVIIATVAVLSPVCFIMGLVRLLFVQGVRSMGSMLVQVIICSVVSLINLPVYEAILVRQDAGRLPTSVALISLTVSLFAYVLPLN